jgi:hypothetical protein
MSKAREALETFVKQYGANAGYAVGFPVLIDALVAEVRVEELRKAAARQRLYDTTNAVNFDRHPDYKVGWKAAVHYVARLLDNEADIPRT